MNVYLAAHDSSFALAAVIVLERFGHRVISTAYDGSAGPTWGASGFRFARLHATVDAQEIREADATLFVGCRDTGNWMVEAGIALGARKPVILVDCLRFCQMLWHPGVECAASVEDAALMLADVPVAAPRSHENLS